MATRSGRLTPPAITPALVATDSMKNFIQRETLNFAGSGLEEYCRFLGQKFLAKYPHAEGLQITAAEVPYGRAGGKAMAPAGPERAFARLEMRSDGLVEARSGIDGFRLLRLGGSAFHGFIRDEYTTLPDLKDRPLHMWLDLAWSYLDPAAAFSDGAVTAAVRSIVERSVQRVRIGQHSGSDLSDGHANARRDSSHRASGSRGQQSHLGCE